MSRAAIDDVRGIMSTVEATMGSSRPAGDKKAYIDSVLPTLTAYSLASIAESLAQLVELTAERT